MAAGENNPRRLSMSPRADIHALTAWVESTGAAAFTTTDRIRPAIEMTA
jgi:hypothetical protein